MNRLTDIQEIWNYLKLVHKHPRNVSRNFENDSATRTGDLQYYLNFCKEVRQWTDGQTYKKSEII